MTGKTNLEIRSTITADGMLELDLVETATVAPGPGEVLVKIEAAPINPADLVPMLAGASVANLVFGSKEGRPHASVRLSDADVAATRGRMGVSQKVGLEGAGIVIEAGAGAEGLLGQRVAILSITGGSFARHATLPASACIPLPPGVSATQGAGLYTNPLTALAMVETLRFADERALVHTAAASNLGQMLQRICIEDGIDLINVVRRPEQGDLLRGLGARWVCDTSSPQFDEALHAALLETGARTAFDAIGGGDMASRLIAAMEGAELARSDTYQPFGSMGFKQVHVYGALNPSPTVLPRSGYGMTWSVAGWANPPILARVGEARMSELFARILAGLTTTFASGFGQTISLEQILDPEVMRCFTSLATGSKVLIEPWA